MAKIDAIPFVLTCFWRKAMKRMLSVLSALLLSGSLALWVPNVEAAPRHHPEQTRGKAKKASKAEPTKKGAKKSDKKFSRADEKKKQGKNNKKNKAKVDRFAQRPAEPLKPVVPTEQRDLNELSSAQRPARLPKGVARAYAMDGSSFYIHGKRIRIQGLDASADLSLTSEHAKQRLQQALDSGAVTFEPVNGNQQSGTVVANVRVSNRDIHEVLRETR
jgi:hypothetical protein